MPSSSGYGSRPRDAYDEYPPTRHENPQQPHYVTPSSSYRRRSRREPQYYISGVAPDAQPDRSALYRYRSPDPRHLTTPNTGLYRSQQSSTTSVSSSGSVQRPQRCPDDPEHPGAARYWVAGGANGPGYYSLTRDGVTVANTGRASSGQAPTYAFEEGVGTGPDHTPDCQHLSRFSDNRGLCFCPPSPR